MFASILMIVGVSSSKRFLLLPWLVLTCLTILGSIILAIAMMISIGNPYSIVVLLICAFPILFGVYFWLNVYTTFCQLKAESSPETTTAQRLTNVERQPKTSEELPLSNRTSTANLCVQGHPQHRSMSDSSFASVKETLQRVIGGTPPPPYEAVARDIDKEEAAIAAGIDRSKLTFTPITNKLGGDTSSTISGTPSQSSIEIVEILKESGAQSRKSSDKSSKGSKKSKKSDSTIDFGQIQIRTSPSVFKETAIISTVNETTAILNPVGTPGSATESGNAESGNTDSTEVTC